METIAPTSTVQHVVRFATSQLVIVILVISACSWGWYHIGYRRGIRIQREYDATRLDSCNKQNITFELSRERYYQFKEDSLFHTLLDNPNGDSKDSIR